MKYYLIVGEASGDLHASHLNGCIEGGGLASGVPFLRRRLMAAVGGVMVKHYKELAYMGSFPYCCICAPSLPI